MKIKTQDLTGAALDWAVAKCEGFNPGVLTIEEQAARHESIMRPHYSDEEWTEHLIGWSKYVLPTLRHRLVNVQQCGFKDEKPMSVGGRGYPFAFSTDWSQGGPIIEDEGIGLLFDSGSACRKPSWFATPDAQCTQEGYEGEYFEPAFMVAESAGLRGPTPLIAAMRCFVASRLGDEVDVPEELI